MDELLALKAQLKMIEFSAEKWQCCPVCGGNQRHDSEIGRASCRERV